jgi:hypothetical protein
MYFKTKKNSETGKKFAEVYKRGMEAVDASNALIKELQKQYPLTGRYRKRGSFFAWGGFSALEFSKEPDSKVWKEILEGEYMPKRNNKEGKRIAKLIDDLPAVQNGELNLCIGFRSFTKHIGFNAGKEYFGFEVEKDWGVKIPSDCEEILSSEYENL